MPEGRADEGQSSAASSTAPDWEDEGDVPPPLPPRNPARTARLPKRQYSDFEYGTLCFLAFCTSLGALGLVIALVVGALDILGRLLGVQVSKSL